MFSGALLAVRRSYYPANALPGKGARWEWAGDVPGEWHTYDMESQCFLETAWAMVSIINMTVWTLNLFFIKKPSHICYRVVKL